MSDLPPIPAPAAPGQPAAVPAQDPGRDRAAKTAREFEAVFIGQMTKLMMESVEVGDQFSGGHGEEMFRGILAEQLGNEISRRGGLGLAPAVMDQIIRLQGQTK